MAAGRSCAARLSPPSVSDDPWLPPSTEPPPAPTPPARPPSVPALPPVPTPVRPPCPPDPEVVSEPVNPRVLVELLLVPPAPSVSKLLEHAATLQPRRKVKLHVASRVRCMRAVLSNGRATV